MAIKSVEQTYNKSIQFIVTATGQSFREPVTGGYALISNTFNNYMVECLEDNVKVLRTFEQDGSIIRQMADGTEIRIVPNDNQIA